MKSDVLKLIRSTKEYMSMETITAATEMSEGTIKMCIKQLIASGYDIDYDKEKGYHLISYPENLTTTELLSRNTCVWVGKKIFYREEIDSTNDEAKRLAEDGRENGTVIVADNQLSGRGRRGRSWISEGKNSIAMSILLRPSFSPDKASMVTLVMALAVADVLSKLTEEEVKIKWPNDIIINKKKVCGILTEMAAEKGAIDHIIIGVGINVNQKDMPEEIASFASSMFIESDGIRYSRSQIILAILEFFEYYYDIFVEREDFSDLVSVYETYLINIGNEVKVLDPKGEFTGTATGINDYGELVIQKENGEFTRVSSGEVSVRGVYGYV